MHILVIVIPIVLSVISALLALIQHYYFPTTVYKRASIYYNTPEFEDLIPTDKKSFELGYPITADLHNEDLVLNDLTSALKYDSKDVGKAAGQSKKQMGTDSEVYNTIQAALAFKMIGKGSKAMKLFEHASAMAPDNADVLNWYGEFLEQHDIVTADELYFKVLKYQNEIN